MVRKLKPNEKLVFDGYAALRAPDGKLIENIPQYIITTENLESVEVNKNEAIVLAGIRTTRGAKQKICDCYTEAILDGLKPKMPDNCTEELFIKVDKSEISKKSQLTEREETSCREIVSFMAKKFNQTTKEMEKLSKKNTK